MTKLRSKPHTYVSNPHVLVDPLGLVSADVTYAGNGEYGPFHRLESPTQLPDVAAKQVVSQEMHGKPPRFGVIPSVKADLGPLPDGESGVEFYTTVRPSDVQAEDLGDTANWYEGSPGVVNINEDWVKIAVRVTKVTQQW